MTLPVANGAPVGAHRENLIASIVAAPGLTIVGGATTGEIAAGASAASRLQFDVSTTQPGVIASAVTLAVTSDDGTGPGSIDGLGTTGLGTTGLGTVVVPARVQVDRYADPAIAATTLGTIVGSGGQADGTLTLTIGGTTDGTFAETVVLTSTDSNPRGFSEALPGQTLTVIGTITDLPLLTISAASSLSVFAATPSLLGPITISDPNTLTQPVTVVGPMPPAC